MKCVANSSPESSEKEPELAAEGFLSIFTLEVLMGVYYHPPYPPSPLPFGIMELGRNSRKIFGFKGLIWKIFRNKELAALPPVVWGGGGVLRPIISSAYGCQRALKNYFMVTAGPALKTGTLTPCPNQEILLHWSGWMSVMALTVWM
jgi:hypothetical protein